MLETDNRPEVTVIPETQFPETADEHEEGVDILDVGVVFTYTWPRFPVISIPLRQITFQAILPNNKIVTYDGFVRDDSRLSD